MKTTDKIMIATFGVEKEMIKTLDTYGERIERSRSWLLRDALRRYLKSLKTSSN